MTTGICRQLSALPGLDGLSSLFRDTGFWQCAVYFLLLTPSSRCRRLAMILMSGTSYGGYNCDVSQLPYGICPGVILAYLGLTLRRVPRLLTSNCDTALAAAKKACFHPRPGVYPMSGIMCSQGGHRKAGQMAKAFSSAQTPRHLCLPGILASLLKTVQSKTYFLCTSARAEWQAQLGLHSS